MCNMYSIQMKFMSNSITPESSKPEFNEKHIHRQCVECRFAEYSSHEFWQKFPEPNEITQVRAESVSVKFKNSVKSYVLI